MSGTVRNRNRWAWYQLHYDGVKNVRLRSEGFLNDLGWNDIYIGLVRDWCKKCKYYYGKNRKLLHRIFCSNISRMMSLFSKDFIFSSFSNFTPNGKVICGNFNRFKGCTLYECHFAHVCNHKVIKWQGMCPVASLSQPSGERQKHPTQSLPSCWVPKTISFPLTHLWTIGP